MATIWFKHNVESLPSAANKGAETAGNWAGNGNHTYSRSTDYAHTGTYSHKVVASDFGGGTVNNHVLLTSAYVPTFTVGTQYILTFWLYRVGAQDIAVNIAGVNVTDVGATTTGAWEVIHVVFTAVTANPALYIWAYEEAATFYFDDITIYQGIEFTTPNMVRGFDEPDIVEFWPPLQHEYSDGGIQDNFTSFRRRFDIDLGVVAAAADRKRLLTWMLDTSRVIDYGTEVDIAVALASIQGFENKWLGNMQYGRSFKFDLRETSVRTSFPV